MTAAALWNKFWFRPGRAEDLAVSRILFGAGLFVFSLSKSIHDWGGVPTAYWRPARFFYYLGVPVLGSGPLEAIELVWRAAIVALTLGLFTRTSAAIVAASSLYLFGVDSPEGLGRSYTPAIFVPGILAFSYCSDALSIDTWLERRRGRSIERAPEEYGWPATLVCTFLSYTFFSAGLMKIRLTGFPDWMLSDMPYRTLLLGNYWYASRNKALSNLGATLLRTSESSALVVGVITQFAELLYPLALIFRVARLVLVPLMLLLLVGIAAAMGPIFALTMLAHVFWVPWSTYFRRTT